jgi:hypothetical protein
MAVSRAAPSLPQHDRLLPHCQHVVLRTIDLSALISPLLRDLSGDFFSATRPFQSDLVGEKDGVLCALRRMQRTGGGCCAHVDWRAARQAHLIIHHFRPLTS